MLEVTPQSVTLNSLCFYYFPTKSCCLFPEAPVSFNTSKVVNRPSVVSDLFAVLDMYVLYLCFISVPWLIPVSYSLNVCFPTQTFIWEIILTLFLYHSLWASLAGDASKGDVDALIGLLFLCF